VFDKTLILQYLCIGNGVFLQNLEFNFSPVTDDIEAFFHWLPFEADKFRIARRIRLSPNEIKNNLGHELHEFTRISFNQ
jgi:hypothetical protein